MRHWVCLWKAGYGGGGLPSWLPAAPAFGLLCCPPSPKGKDRPPTRARRALFPAGRGRLGLFYARGFAPCIPGAGWDAALGLLVESGLWRGGLPGRHWGMVGAHASGGGACFLCRLPTLPGTFSFFHPHFPAGRQGTNHRVQSILNIRESSGGSGGLFQESPSVLPVVSPVPSANAVRRERVRERPSRCMTV